MERSGRRAFRRPLAGVGNDGAAFGVANNTSLTVSQMLTAVNNQAVDGVLFNGDAHLRDLAEDLFERLNRAAD
jgi:hypothetical protein